MRRRPQIQLSARLVKYYNLASSMFHGFMEAPLGRLFCWCLNCLGFCRPQTFPLDDFFRLCNFHVDTHECGISPIGHLDILFFFYYSKDKKAYIIFWWPQRFSISCDDFPVSALQTFVASEKRRRALRRICSMWTLPMCMVWLPVGATPKF